MADGYTLLHTGAAVWLDRDVISVSGPDAAKYLQGQLSQDVSNLAASTWSWILQPQGKVDALLRVTPFADTFILDTEAGWGQALADRLNRFKLRTKAEVTLLPWRCLALRGSADNPLVATAAAPSDGVVATVSWPGMTGVDLLGAEVDVPGDLPVVDAADYEVLRIEAGVPRMGAELTERTIPAETGLVPVTVSFTKGCYTGQELVARIDSRGSHVAKNLRGLRLAGPAQAGASLEAGGKSVGTLTSVAESPALGWVGLGYVGRSVEPGGTVTVEGSPGEARVELLPLVP
ncbi:MAG: YgfZ/GcvT domain-containing protein [Acidimicrobiales bacterium]